MTIPELETLYDDYATRASPASKQYMEIGRNMRDTDLKLVAPSNLTPSQLNKWNAVYYTKNAAYAKAKGSMRDREILQWKYNSVLVVRTGAKARSIVDAYVASEELENDGKTIIKVLEERLSNLFD